MEHEPEEHENTSNQPASLEAQSDARTPELLAIDDLAAWLGYVESPEMVSAREQWAEAIRTGDERAQSLALKYQELAVQAEDVQRLQFRNARESVTTAIIRQTQSEDMEEILAAAAGAGFIETPDMRLMRARIALNAGSATEVTDLRSSYNHQADRLESALGAKSRIGLMLAKAGVWRDAGKLEFYQEDLDDIVVVAQGMGTTHGSPFNEIASAILSSG
jgi:hypothetical protein